MRGYGDSDKPAGVDGHDARALAEEGRALTAQLGHGRGRPVNHAAHDMGALPALLRTADRPEEVAGLLYIEAPVMLGEPLHEIIALTPRAMERGSMWWWIIPFAPGVPERLVVGNERAFLTWFYDGATVRRDAIEPAAVDGYLRTSSGRDGVLGAMGIYRAAFASIEQTEPLLTNKIRVPVVATGGEKGLGARVGAMVRMVAHDVEAETPSGCGHFLPEERPDAVIRQVLALAAATARRPTHPKKDTR